ncbi:pentapeptide repeat-containing protein [Vagococcus sp. WN89Y]|uniref:pentapeptide repeat-containing protein n=1 Tax=Vagococcus sp. WN89Y TaxID=3457258 RepID=UPI003FCCBF23
MKYSESKIQTHINECFACLLLYINFFIKGKSMRGIMFADRIRFPGDIIDPQNRIASEVTEYAVISHRLTRVTPEEYCPLPQRNSAAVVYSRNTFPVVRNIKSIHHDDVNKNSAVDFRNLYSEVQKIRELRRKLAYSPARSLPFRLMYNDLRSFDFTNINKGKYEIREPVAVDFSYANMERADLRLAWLNGSNFTYANLNEAKLFIQCANFFGAALNGAKILLDLPCHWREQDVDALLNNPETRGNLFHTIASVSDEYVLLKTAMMQQLSESIIGSPGAIASCSFPASTFIKNILEKEFYMENTVIKGFVGGLVQKVINQSSGQFMLNKVSNSTLSNIIKFTFESDEQHELECDVITNNGFFIQLIMRSVYSDSPTLQQQGRTLYATYLEREEIKPYTLKEEFGDGAGKPDWSAQNNLNYILVSGDKTMIIDHENIARMLRQDYKEGEIKWNNFFLYDNDQLQATGSIDYEELFNKHFKIFANSYRFDSHKSSLKKLLALLELAEYDEKFYAVLSGKTLAENESLTGADDQFRLNAIFCKVLTPVGESVKETTLLAEHYREIMDVFQLRQAENTLKAQTLLCLAAVFCRYSSSFAFGTVKESPQVLRQYAYALMHKANELCPQITEGQFEEWKACLLGLNAAFTCSGVLSATMIEHVRTHFPDVASTLLPPVW